MNETEHEPERELEALQDQADNLGERISDVREDWEGKKRDPAVPGAEGDPLAAGSEDPAATANGSSQTPGEDLPVDEPLDPQDPANEDL